MTMIGPRSELPMACGNLRRDLTVPDDLRLVCLWSALGLTLTGLFLAMGLGADIAQALMAAG